MKRSLAIACLAAVLSTAAFAQDPEIPFDEFYLDNGLRVIVHEDRKAPIVAVTIWYHVGSKNEVPGKTGFAHLFEHLMFNGSENHNDEYFRPLQEVGATSMNGTTDFDRTNYFQTVPTSAVDLALWLESDRMGHLLGAIDQEQARRAARRRAERETPGRQRAVRQGIRDDHHESLPAGAPVLVGRHRLDGGPERREPRGRQDVVRDVLRAQQRDARARRRHRRRHGARESRALLRRHSARPAADAPATLDSEQRSLEPDRHAGPRARSAHL